MPRTRARCGPAAVSHTVCAKKACAAACPSGQVGLRRRGMVPGHVSRQAAERMLGRPLSGGQDRQAQPLQSAAFHSRWCRSLGCPCTVGATFSLERHGPPTVRNGRILHRGPGFDARKASPGDWAPTEAGARWLARSPFTAVSELGTVVLAHVCLADAFSLRGCGLGGRGGGWAWAWGWRGGGWDSET